MEPIRRVTAPTLDVLDALLDGPDAAMWGLLVIKRTGRAPGTVYPILERLERQGWIESSWEDDRVDRSGPRRRLYAFTAAGALAARDLLDAHRSRQRDRATAGRRPGGRPVTS